MLFLHPLNAWKQLEWESQRFFRAKKTAKFSTIKVLMLFRTKEKALRDIVFVTRKIYTDEQKMMFFYCLERKILFCKD